MFFLFLLFIIFIDLVLVLKNYSITTLIQSTVTVFLTSINFFF